MSKIENLIGLVSKYLATDKKNLLLFRKAYDLKITQLNWTFKRMTDRQTDIPSTNVWKSIGSIAVHTNCEINVHY